jgi:uncharacterized membrane protein
MPWNLVLAWMSLVITWWLCSSLKTNAWLSGRNLALSVLWMLFLPNTWYVLTDFIHVYPNGEISQIFDIVLMSLFVLSAFVLGFASLYIVHKEFLKRLDGARSYLLVEVIILISSFAIYLGRDLRWNSWDVIKNPGGVIVNVSDKVADPLGSPRAVSVTLLFFILISVLYGAIWILNRPSQRR